jgi:hypothetical protein
MNAALRHHGLLRKTAEQDAFSLQTLGVRLQCCSRILTVDS